MYQFSRSIYRELAPDILDDPIRRPRRTNHERVLRAMRGRDLPPRDRSPLLRATVADAVQRHPRSTSRCASQDHVYRVVDRYMTFARKWFEAQTTGGYDLAGNRLECRATTRKGTPCQRTPLPHNGYCPSHQHLAETEERSPSTRRGSQVARLSGGIGSLRADPGVARDVAECCAGRLHRAGDHGLAPGREPAPRRPRADGLQPHAARPPSRGRRSTARTRRRLARARSPSGADVVITMVVDGAQVEAMLLGEDGAADGARAGDAVRRHVDDRAGGRAPHRRRR